MVVFKVCGAGVDDNDHERKGLGRRGRGGAVNKRKSSEKMCSCHADVCLSVCLSIYLSIYSYMLPYLMAMMMTPLCASGPTL